VGEKKEERWRTEDLLKHVPDAACDRPRRRFIEEEGGGERNKEREIFDIYFCLYPVSRACYNCVSNIMMKEEKIR